MTKTIKGNLILEKDTEFDESIAVEGNILGKDGLRFNLKVEGDISARNINALDISALDISALNINALDISARDIRAWNISALDISALNISAWDISANKIVSYWGIVCNFLKVKVSFKARFVIQNKDELEQKENHHQEGGDCSSST